MPYDESTVARLLAAQGFDVPASDLTEIATRVQDVLKVAATWDALAPHEAEPWWPGGLAGAEAPGWTQRVRHDEPASTPLVSSGSPEEPGGTDPSFASIADLQALYRRGALSPVELVQAQLARADRLDPHLRAFIHRRDDEALRDAARAEADLRAEGPRSPLHGVTVGIKDQMLVQGLPLTGGSRVLPGDVSDRDATVVARLRAAGAIVLGTLNTHEFHAGGTRRFPFGTPRNPWSLAHAPGASSSGSAAAVAAGLCTLSLGGDTGGSIRGPASNCGVVGLKPTWSRVSRDGVIPLAPTLDAVGPFARRVRDVAHTLAAIAGGDPRDPTTSRRPVDVSFDADGTDLRGLRVGVIEELMDMRRASPASIAAVEGALDVLAGLGAVVERVRLPLVPHALGLMGALTMPEAIGFHRPWLLARYEAYDTTTRTRLLAAAILPTGVHASARRLRTRVAEQVADALRGCAVLVSPTSGVPPQRLDEATPPAVSPTLAAYNLSGHPALSVPCGFDDEGLPLGLQIAGRAFDERTLLAVADAYEGATRWYERRPTDAP